MINEIPSIDDFRSVFLSYTRQAFKALPMINKPRILDIGCGSGVVTIELTKLTDGEIIGMDLDEMELKKLKKKIQEKNLTFQITVKNSSLLNSGLKKESFDIIWAEGVIHIIGFKKAFNACNELLKPGGFLVLTEAIEGINRNKNFIKESGFELHDQIDWEKGCWLTKYYEPLERTIKKLREAGIPSDLFTELLAHEGEISWVRKNLNESDCAHYILKKI